MSIKISKKGQWPNFN